MTRLEFHCKRLQQISKPIVDTKDLGFTLKADEKTPREIAGQARPLSQEVLAVVLMVKIRCRAGF